MTSRPSSISSSSFRRYLIVAAVLFVTALVGMVTLSMIGYGLGLVDASNRNLFDYQVRKIDQADQIDIVFVGDSSLGNAIDADLFGKLAGARTLNLALSGTYGVGASYNMVRRSFERHHPRLVVVMQSLKTMKRPEAAAGYFFTTDHPQWSDLSPVELAKVYLSFRAASETITQIRRNGLTRMATVMVGDYVPQQMRGTDRLAPPAEVAEEPLLPGMISHEQLRFLQRIGTFCKSQGVPCLYASGPIYDGYCAQSAAYQGALADAVRAAGLTMVEGTPLCMPIDHVGDAVDHVKPEFKDEYTRRYFAAIAPDIVVGPKVATFLTGDGG
ncbi:hypothetical protein [Hypericibacter sp.]|uniref:hypothetical protein n=1 Tax=Hypericibacter sp. TaxID=2705401 RepID=UPI003D6D3132